MSSTGCLGVQEENVQYPKKNKPWNKHINPLLKTAVISGYPYPLKFQECSITSIPLSACAPCHWPMTTATSSPDTRNRKAMQELFKCGNFEPKLSSMCGLKISGLGLPCPFFLGGSVTCLFMRFLCFQVRK